MPNRPGPTGSPATGNTYDYGRALKLGAVGIVVAGLGWYLLRPLQPVSKESPQVREVAKLEQKRDAAGLAARVGDRDDTVAIRAMQGLGTLGGQDAARQIAPALQDSRPQVRAMAAIQYASAGAVDVQPLNSVLQADPSTEVRVAAAEGIGRLRAFDGMEALLKGLMDADAEVRRASITAIEQVLPGVHFQYDPNGPPSDRLAVANSIRRQYPKWKANYDLAMKRLKEKGER